MDEVIFKIIRAALSGIFIACMIMPEAACESCANEFSDGSGPSFASDGSRIHMVFANGDSILYSYSSCKERNFSRPSLVAVLKGLMVAGGRGPQIACSGEQLVVAAPSASGNILTYNKTTNGKAWSPGGRINDIPDMAKEGFVSLAVNESEQLFAVWLDLRLKAKNNIYSSRSTDGGKTWDKNLLIYSSPDGGVCECCKPCIKAQEKQLSVMFRNNIDGNRDMYLTRSVDGGATFGPARKLGQVSWKINACPMDGGSLVINDDNTVMTVWRREADIYMDMPGKKEELLTRGSHCSVAGKNGSYFIAYVQGGNIFCRLPDGKITVAGQGGGYPQLIMVDNSTVLCGWDNGNKIFYTFVSK